MIRWSLKLYASIHFFPQTKRPGKLCTTFYLKASKGTRLIDQQGTTTWTVASSRISRTVSHMREHYHWMYGCCGIVGDFWFRSKWSFLLSWVIFLFKSAIKINMNPTSEDALFSLGVIYCLPIDRSNLRWHKSSNLSWDSYVKYRISSF